jgi:hypothetical protein
MTDKRFDSRPKNSTRVRAHERQTKNGTVIVREHVRSALSTFRNSARTEEDFRALSSSLYEMRFPHQITMESINGPLRSEISAVGSAWNKDKDRRQNVDYYLERLDRAVNGTTTDDQAWGDFQHDASLGTDGDLSKQQRQLTMERMKWSCLKVPGGHSFAGLYLGEGLGSVTDYGRSNDLSDTEMIAKVQEETLKSGMANQFTKYRNKQTGYVANEIVIVRRDNGYSVIPRYNPEA